MIGNNYEGCDVTTTTPVCDGDKDDATAVTKTYASDKTAQCVGCKKSSTYLSVKNNYIHIKHY